MGLDSGVNLGADSGSTMYAWIELEVELGPNRGRSGIDWRSSWGRREVDSGSTGGRAGAEQRSIWDGLEVELVPNRGRSGIDRRSHVSPASPVDPRNARGAQESTWKGSPASKGAEDGSGDPRSTQSPPD